MHKSTITNILILIISLNLISSSPYRTLGVSRFDSMGKIKEKYKELIRKYHPDKAKNKDEAKLKFIEIQSAFEKIKNDKTGFSYYTDFTDENGDVKFDFKKNFNFESKELEDSIKKILYLIEQGYITVEMIALVLFLLFILMLRVYLKVYGFFYQYIIIYAILSHILYLFTVHYFEDEASLYALCLLIVLGYAISSKVLKCFGCSKKEKID